MSSANPGSSEGNARPVLPASALEVVTARLSTLAFWVAIVLPAVYLPLLAVGIDGVSGLGLFLGLFGLHVLALVGGHAHARSPGDGRRRSER